LEFPSKIQGKVFRNFKKIPRIILAKTNHQIQKSLLTLSKKNTLPEGNLEGFKNHFVQRVVKRCGVFLLKKFRFAPILKPLNATSKELWWMFRAISLLVQIFFPTLLLSPY